MKFLDEKSFSDVCTELNKLTVPGCDRALDGMLFAFTREECQACVVGARHGARLCADLIASAVFHGPICKILEILTSVPMHVGSYGAYVAVCGCN